jgi:proteasome lid subunit RPN8/RPN11
MLTISRRDHDAMLQQLEAAYPLEACGLMAGKDSRVLRLYPITNLLASPYAYEMDPAEQVTAMLDIEDRGWEMLAIYHSHPHGPERPSHSDIAQAYYPDSLYVIVSFRSRQSPITLAFQISDSQVTEIAYKIA